MHPNDKDLELHRLGLLSSRQTSTIKSHLADCALCAGKIELSMQLSRWKTGEGVERRNEKRVDVQEPASLRILRDASESIECQVVNRSKGGMGLRLATPLEPGSMIQIRLKDRIVMAEVRHCRRAGEEYSVGIKVEDEMTFGKEPKA